MASFDESHYDAVAEDVAFVRATLPDACVETLSREIISFVVLRTVYSRIQVRIMLVKGYPDKIPIVELSSKTLPPPLLRSKEKECLAVAKTLLGKAQVEAIFYLLYDFVQENMFVPCWKEVKKLAAMCEGSEHDHKFGCDEKTGVVQLRLRNGAYRQSINLIVPKNYPEDAVSVELPAGNLPYSIMNIYKGHADDVARRCIAGFTPEDALATVHEVDAGRSQRTVAEKAATAKQKVSVTSSSLRGLKHDVKVLKQMGDLRVANTGSKEKGNNQTDVYSSQERKVFRKDLRRLAKSEMTTDMIAEEDDLRKAEREEMSSLVHTKPSPVAQPGLLAVATYLVQHYFDKLPQEKCLSCKQCAFPTDPSSPDLCNPKSDKRPMRTYCGHWLHFKCLDTWLTTPPFVHNCPVCDRRIWHPDWPEDHKQLEKAYNAEQARFREISDVSDFLDFGGLSDAFKR